MNTYKQMSTKQFLSHFLGHVIQYYLDCKSFSGGQNKNDYLKPGPNPETRPSLVDEYAKAKQENGCSVCFSPNGFKNGKRIMENLDIINAVFLDIDSCKEKDGLDEATINNLKKETIQKIREFPIAPHFITETKHGYQPIYLVKDFTKQDFDKIVNFLILELNGDPGRKDVCGVLRVPGYFNLKNPSKPFLCTLIHKNTSLNKYSPDIFYSHSSFPATTELIKPSPAQNTTTIEHRTSPEITKAIDMPLKDVFEFIPPMVGISVTLKPNANGSFQVIENGTSTSCFISANGNFCESTSGKNRKGNPITLAKYYLNEIGEHNYNAQEIANIIISRSLPALINDDDDYVTAGELTAMDLPEPQFIIDDILPSIGIMLLSGLPGSYKTWIYLYFSHCIINGLPVFGIYKTTPTNILLINIDDYIVDIRDRLKKARIEDNGLSKLFVRQCRKFLILDETDSESIIKQIKKYSIGLVIVDTLRHSHHNNENDSGEMDIVMGKYKEISSNLDCSFLIVHHDGKEQNGKTVITAPSGSINISGNCIASIRLKTTKQKDYVTFDGGKSKRGEKLDSRTLHFDLTNDSLFTIALAKAEEAIDTIKANIISFYELTPNPNLIKDEFVEYYRKNHLASKNNIEKALKSLQGEGKLECHTGANNRKEFFLSSTSTQPP